jgi:hypothetical protein
MKNLGLLFAFNLYQVVSCKNNESEKIDEVLKVPAEKPISVGCYQAIYEEDTLDLKINTFKNGEVTGDMDMAISNMPKKLKLEISGEFRGDTLFASYTIQGGYKKTYKKSMAFLKRGDDLILGNGEIQITLEPLIF